MNRLELAISRPDSLGAVSGRDAHGWKQHFAQDVADHHEDILCRLRDHFAKAK